MSNLKIITVVNDLDCYNKTIKNNPNMNKYEITIFDNIKKNIGISKRYNSYIKKNIFTNKVKDSWLIFCHQDFAFLEDALPILEEQDKNCIYGVTGVKKRKIGNLKFKMKGLIPTFFIKTKVLGIGQIHQGYDPKKFKKAYKKNPFIMDGENFYLSNKLITKPVEVDTVDCCCVIIHSSLIKKEKLLFDENLEWHCYAEDMCLNAKYNHNIPVKVIQFKCKHLSRGDSRNESFEKFFEYIANKYKGKKFCTPCRNTYDIK